jgi:hypothetical protein
MKYLLRLECIGDGAPHSPIFQKLGIHGPPRYYVYALSLVNGCLTQRPMKHFKDFTQANGAGTRGVYAEYILSEGECYEVKQPKSWNRADQYYCTVRDGELVRLTKYEVMTCLVNTPLGLPSMKPQNNA